MSGGSALLIFSVISITFFPSILPEQDWTLYSAKGVISSYIENTDEVFDHNNLCTEIAHGIDAQVEWSDSKGYIVYQHQLATPIDLTRFDRIAFKAAGGSELVFIGFEDKNGHQIFYGPNGADMTNLDFILEHQGSSKELDVVLFDPYQMDYPVFVGSEREFDFAHVKNILFQLSAYNGPSNIYTTPILGCADMLDKIEPKLVSPNFDDVNDELNVLIHTSKHGKRAVFIESNTVNRTKISEVYLKWGRNKIKISRGSIANLKDGSYKLVFEGGGERKIFDFEIDNSYFWDYSGEPESFDLAAYVAGESSALEGVTNFKAHFTRAFSQMRSWGLDAAIVLNPKKEIWDDLTSAADNTDMKLILHLWPLDELILSDHEITEQELLTEIETLQNETQEAFEDAFGFYLTDEPHESAAENLGLAVKILSALYPQKPVFTTFNRLVRMKNLINSLPRNSAFAFDAYPIAFNDNIGNFIVDGGGYKTIDPMDYADYAANVRNMSSSRRIIAAVQAHGWPEILREPTEQELSALSWLAISEGAGSLVYFLYMDAHDFAGLVDNNFNERPRVTAIKKIAQTLPAIKRELDGLKPTSRIWLNSKVQATLFSNSKRSTWLVVNRDMYNTYSIPIPCHQKSATTYGSCGSITILPGDAALVNAELRSISSQKMVSVLY